MKKMISVLAITAFTFGFAQETPKKACCAGKNAKECKMDGKKTAKDCHMKNQKDVKTAEANKKPAAKKAA